MLPIKELIEDQFSVPSIRHEIENESGIIRFNTRQDFGSSEKAAEWFLEFCKEIGTPVSQSPEGDLVLSIKISHMVKMILVREVQTPTKN